MPSPTGAAPGNDAAHRAPPLSTHRRWLPAWVPKALTGLLLVLGLGFAVGESMGWPFLVEPLQNQLQQRSGRTVALQTQAAPASLHLWGGIRLQSPQLEISAPGWSRTPFVLSASDVDVRLRYGDVWRAWQGERLVVQALIARQLTVHLERNSDGRASWQLDASKKAPQPPHVQTLDVRDGALHVDDALLALKLHAELALSSPEPSLSALPDQRKRVLRGTATGSYRTHAFRISLVSTGSLPWEVVSAQATPVDVKLSASVGRASLDFQGTAQDLLHLNGLHGALRVQGPSLAALGAPLGLALPTTAPFRANGQLQRSGAQWTLALRSAQVGDSQLSGAFAFDTAAQPPRLSGTLNGSLLKLADLGPALGMPLVASSSAPKAKVLPTRAFDLAALRAMDADVQIAIAQVDTNTTWLEPLRPFAAHLQLTAGVLTLTDIDARTAKGHLRGTLALDGKENRAHWVAALNWDSVQLQNWLRQNRADGLPPYVTGQLRGFATLQGTGRSTAEILATLQGDIGASVDNGTLSHLLVEMGGLDVAESLGVLLKGDDALVLDCAIADLAVSAGSVRPRLLVLDTPDSTVWIDGTLSLATEQIDLRAVVAPKDFSLLTLRAPLQIRGSFAKPQVAIEKGPLGLKLGSALLLGLLNPLAALVPLVDAGNQQEAKANAASCKARMHQKLQRARASLRGTP